VGGVLLVCRPRGVPLLRLRVQAAGARMGTLYTLHALVWNRPPHHGGMCAEPRLFTSACAMRACGMCVGHRLSASVCEVCADLILLTHIRMAHTSHIEADRPCPTHMPQARIAHAESGRQGSAHMPRAHGQRPA